MVIPRKWGTIELQRDPSQTQQFAEPSATDTRFKVASILLFICWLLTVFSLRHSIDHYKPRHRGIFNRILGLLSYTPLKFLLILPLSLALIAYTTASSFLFPISPLNNMPSIPFIYGLGWLPIALIFLTLEISGYVDPNEDRELIRQRRIRGEEADHEMGYTKKPHWWSRLHGLNHNMSVHERIARNVVEIGGGTVTTRGVERSIELENMNMGVRTETRDSGKVGSGRSGSGDIEVMNLASNFLFPPGSNVETQERFTDRPEESRGRKRVGADGPNENVRPMTGERSNSNLSTGSGMTLGVKPQQIRSMLDV